MSENEEKNIKRCKVLIIGGGMAGLSAGNHLMQNGLSDFKILEARNRIGGRIISIDIGTQKVFGLNQLILNKKLYLFYCSE